MLTSEQIEEFRAKYIDIEHVKGKPNIKKVKGKDGVVSTKTEDTWELVLKKPTRAAYKKYRIHINSGPALKADAHENLVRDMLVYPDLATFSQWLEGAYVGIAESTVVNKATDKLCGYAAEEGEG